jgi:Fuc2NAc and GlcNAc transferase
MIDTGLGLAAICLIATLMLLSLYVGWAKGRMVDTPNERSAHVVATPTGGGIVFLSVWILMLGAAALLVPYQFVPALALGPAVLGLMWLGWIDDRTPLPTTLRFAVQFGSAGLFLLLWPWPPLPAPLSDACFWLLAVVALLYLVYSANITNFMDGIDAIVALQIIAFVAGALLILPPSVLSLPLMLLGAAVLGFFLFNRPPAKLFMGDSGSAPLGLIVAAVTLAVAASDWRLGLALLVLQGVFLCDSAVTLLRRFLRRQNITQAHSEHAYQHAKRRWGHARVSYALFALTMLVQLPVAYVVGADILPFWIAAIDLVLVALFAAFFRAGTARTD